MRWALLYSRRAAKSIGRLPRNAQVRLLAELARMQEDPLRGDVKALRNHPVSFRRRVGSYRVLFDVDLATKTVLIHDVLRRSDTTYR